MTWWIKQQSDFIKSAACFAVIGFLWLKEEVDAAASYRSGEKDFGVGILAMLAVILTVILAPIGLAFLIFGIAKVRRERDCQPGESRSLGD